MRDHQIIRQDFKSVIYYGAAIDYNKISICDLRRMLPEYRVIKVGRYQVEASGSQLKFSKIYKNIDDALDKFFEIVQGTS